MKPTPNYFRISAAFFRGFQFAIFLAFFTLSTVSSAQSFLCTGAPFTTANIITANLNNCDTPISYAVINSNVAGVPVTPANQNAAATYTPTGTGTFTIEISDDQGDPCTTQTFSVIGFTGTQATCSDYDFSVAPAVVEFT